MLMPDNVSALQLLLTADPTLLAIVRLSLLVSFAAVILGGLIGVPLGAGVALTRFAGREAVIVVLNALMGLPPVVVGLAVYLLLSRSGPLGSWGLLFTPQAMIIAQTILVAPIIAALTRQTIEDLWTEYRDELAAMDVGPLGSWGLLFTPQAMIIAQTILVAPIIAALTRQTIEDLWTDYRDELAAMDVGPLGRIATLIWDGRFSLVTALLAGFGRAAAEVGAILIVGGNIDGFTRTMTTAIALETSKGDLPLAIGLGVVLVAIVVLVNAAAWGLRRAGERFAG
jgi:tungstate transport system permease protein